MTSAPIFPVAGGGVLVASPSTSLREQVRQSLHDPRWPVQEALGGADALAKLESGQWQVLFLDRRLPDLDGEELIQIIRLRFPGIEVVMLDSGAGAVLPSDMPSWRGPAKSVRPTILPAMTDEDSQLRLEPAQPRREEVEPLPGMIGSDEAMRRVYQMARLVAPRNTTVLILGATGTGKELVARAIHGLSRRAAHPLVVVNCAALPETLLESELFGYARGAFTGAAQAYAGRIQAAQGGTLFLDEIGELPLSVQGKLLRFLDQKEVQRLGSPETARVDVRVVAATNLNLARAVEENKFRADLYYRVAAFPLELPPLAERVQDILPLARHFLRMATAGTNCRVPELHVEAAQELESQAWRGNARELQQVMERAAILAEGGEVIRCEHLSLPLRQRADASLSGPGSVVSLSGPV